MFRLFFTNQDFFSIASYFSVADFCCQKTMTKQVIKFEKLLTKLASPLLTANVQSTIKYWSEKQESFTFHVFFSSTKNNRKSLQPAFYFAHKSTFLAWAIFNNGNILVRKIFCQKMFYGRTANDFPTPIRLSVNSSLWTSPHRYKNRLQQ